MRHLQERWRISAHTQGRAGDRPLPLPASCQRTRTPRPGTGAVWRAACPAKRPPWGPPPGLDEARGASPTRKHLSRPHGVQVIPTFCSAGTSCCSHSMHPHACLLYSLPASRHRQFASRAHMQRHSKTYVRCYYFITPAAWSLLLNSWHTGRLRCCGTPARPSTAWAWPCRPGHSPAG